MNTWKQIERATGETLEALEATAPDGFSFGLLADVLKVFERHGMQMQPSDLAHFELVKHIGAVCRLMVRR